MCGMVFAMQHKHTGAIAIQHSVEDMMEILSKIAAVFVTLLLYCVITILQMPKSVHATPGPSAMPGQTGALPATQPAARLR